MAYGEKVQVEIPSLPVEVTRGDQGAALFSGANIQYPFRTGEPSLPARNITVLLPPDTDLGTVTAWINETTIDEIPGRWDIEPVPPVAIWDAGKVSKVWPEDRTLVNGRDIGIYGVDAPFPQEVIVAKNPGQMRKWVLVDIAVSMYQYNPVRNKLYRLVEGIVVVEFERKRMDLLSEAAFVDRIGEEGIRRRAVNFEAMAPAYQNQASLQGSPQNSSYVIITTEAIRSGSGQLQNFVSNREARGFAVYVVTENEWGGGTGDTAAENIRNYLINNYQRMSIEYVLLIGNPHPGNGDVPMKMCWPRNNATSDTSYKECPRDLYYADLTGNWDLDGDGKYAEWADDFGEGGVDRIWEVIVGRIPCYGNLNDLDHILSKICDYESESETSWRKNVLLPMKPSDGDTPGYQLGEAIKDYVVIPKPGWFYHRVYEQDYGLDPLPEKTPCTVENGTNAWVGGQFGAAFWWTPGADTLAVDVMDVSHCAALNDTYPSFSFQCSCLNSQPETPNTLTYTLLKNGCINTIGATRVSW